jgi:hypothetical protein
MKLEFSRQIFETIQIPSFIITHPVGAELFHSDGRTDMTKLIIAFRNFVNAPDKDLISFLTKWRPNNKLNIRTGPG